MDFSEAFEFVSRINGSLDKNPAKLIWHLAKNPQLAREAYEAELMRVAISRLELGDELAKLVTPKPPTAIKAVAVPKKKAHKFSRERKVKASNESVMDAVRNQLKGGGRCTLKVLAEVVALELKEPKVLPEFLKRILEKMGPEIKWDHSVAPLRVGLTASSTKALAG